MAVFFDSPGNDTFSAYAPDCNSNGDPSASMSGSYAGYPNGYSNSAKGFDTNVAWSTNGGSDTATFYYVPGTGQDSYYKNTGQAGMYGAGYSNAAIGFATYQLVAQSGSDAMASLSDSPNKHTLYTDLAIAQLYGDN
jgi:hypothetical protein